VASAEAMEELAYIDAYKKSKELLAITQDLRKSGKSN
jgi:hypothetical protein